MYIRLLEILLAANFKKVDFSDFTASYGTLNFDGSVMSYTGYLSRPFEKTNRDVTTYEYFVYNFNKMSEKCDDLENIKSCMDETQ